MTAPPREIAPEPCANCGKARSDHYIVNFADGPQISGMTWICPGSVYEASPAPSADNKPTPGMLRGLSKIAADLAAYRNGTAPSAEPPAQAATDARPEDYFPELVPGDKTLALVGALGRLADYFSPQSGSADAHAIQCKCSKCEWADDIREAGRVLEQQAREIAKLRNANSST